MRGSGSQNSVISGFIGAGYPDYPWIFATDAEYTAFAAVADRFPVFRVEPDRDA